MIMKLRLEKCVKRRNADTVVITQKKIDSKVKVDSSGGSWKEGVGEGVDEALGTF